MSLVHTNGWGPTTEEIRGSNKNMTRFDGTAADQTPFKYWLERPRFTVPASASLSQLIEVLVSAPPSNTPLDDGTAWAWAPAPRTWGRPVWREDGIGHVGAAPGLTPGDDPVPGRPSDRLMTRPPRFDERLALAGFVLGPPLDDRPPGRTVLGRPITPRPVFFEEQRGAPGFILGPPLDDRPAQRIVPSGVIPPRLPRIEELVTKAGFVLGPPIDSPVPPRPLSIGPTVSRPCFDDGAIPVTAAANLTAGDDPRPVRSLAALLRWLGVRPDDVVPPLAVVSQGLADYPSPGRAGPARTIPSRQVPEERIGSPGFVLGPPLDDRPVPRIRLPMFLAWLRPDDTPRVAPVAAAPGIDDGPALRRVPGRAPTLARRPDDGALWQQVTAQALADVPVLRVPLVLRPLAVAVARWSEVVWGLVAPTTVSLTYWRSIDTRAAATAHADTVDLGG